MQQTTMIDHYTPTYTIRNIADVSAEQLDCEGIGGLVFVRSRGILTSTINERWFPYARSLRALGGRGVRFYLVADPSVPSDFFRSANDQLAFDTVIEHQPLHTALRKVPHRLEMPSLRHPEMLEWKSMAVVGNWLSDIAEGNRAGFPTILMPELLGVRGLKAVVTHPVEVSARVVRRLPFRAASFKETLQKDGQAIGVIDDETQEYTDRPTEEA